MLNVVCLMGRLAADPELRHTQSQIPVTSFRIAVDRTFQSKGQEKQTDWIDIVAWRNTAEFVTRYFHKGSMIAVQGSIQTRSYTDKDGNKRTAFEVVADNVFFGESKRDSGGAPPGIAMIRRFRSSASPHPLSPPPLPAISRRLSGTMSCRSDLGRADPFILL